MNGSGESLKERNAVIAYLKVWSHIVQAPDGCA
jgi:hypothetical protein